MWGFGLPCGLMIFLGILGTGFCADPFAKQPRIAVEDGHLTIQSAQNRNVSFKVSGQGAVRINDVDMTRVLSSVSNGGNTQSSSMISLNRRVTQIINQWQSVSDLVSQVNQLEENITEIYQRLSQFGPTNRGMRRYFAKVKVLEDKVNRLTELLSNNECSSNPCRNGGTCVDSYNGYICNCPSNWEGPTCESDINECSVYAGTAFGCQNGATCTNLPGSYRCDCATNWYGIHCSQQHDDCSSASHSELCGHGTCVNEQRVQPGQPKYRCICDAGWTSRSGNPACTEDIDECQDTTPRCSANPRVMCINLPGTFHCGPCPAGYTGNGIWCDDINECEFQNGGCSISPFVECINTRGSRRCGPCPAGYFGNGEQCMFQSVCSMNRGGCHPLAACIENPAITGTYRECRCPAGYIGSGEGLTGCVQAQGMSCANNPCQHGTCQMFDQSYHCTCFAGYFGTNCDQQIDPCFSNPCLNGGTCVRGRGSFICTCAQGYEGSTCEIGRQACGGYLNSNNGTLQYPENSAQYDHRESCAWVITVPDDKIVNITFERFQVEHGQNCEFDFLQLNDGPNAGSRVVGRFCGYDLHGESFTSTHNQVYLWFASDRSVAAAGFKIHWTSVDPVCGGVLNETDYGSVRSPGYPGLYPLNRTCSWLVQVPLGKRIQFSFATLMLETHENCSYDYLKVFDGATDRDPLIGTYCTTETPPPLTTSGHIATLLFHSDQSVQDHGFNIAYSSIPAIEGCGGTVTAPQGSVTSPNYPNVYQDNLLCEWLIRIHPDNRIHITFTNFILEAHSNCGFDSLEVYDGSSDASPLLGRFCGTDLPPDIMSNSNKVYIRFKTDGSQRHPGFKLDYKTICGGLFTSLTGVLSSPYYPDPYPASATCLYDIRLPEGYLVNLTIHNLEIEAHSECNFDFLEIRDGHSEDSPVLGRLCGNTSPTESIVSTYNYLWMKFQTDSSVQNRGFYAQYEAIAIGCGGIMVSDSGQISSPSYPDSYTNLANCTWLIRAPETHVIRLSFTTFILEADSNCNYDYVLIEDINGVQIGKYCGGTVPPVLTSLDNTLIVKFVTDSSVVLDGFIANYEFLDAKDACGGDIYQGSGTIRSPGFPNHYPHTANCIWTIQAANNRQILLNITSFNLEYHAECRYDYLEIRNGRYASSPLIGKFCGDRIMRIIRSHSNTLRLVFKTDSSQSHPGFEIQFDSTSVGCGGVLNSSRGSIVSPNYPQPYPLNADCQWLIRVAEGSSVSLTIVDIDIEQHATCEFDYLQIFDGDSEHSKTLSRVCNNQQHLTSFVSSGNTMFLRFRTDYSHEAGGFHAVYHSSCNNVLTKRRGAIESPNFPNPYPHNHNCTWTIQAPAGTNISLSFTHLLLEESVNCSIDFVEVMEMRQGEPFQLGKFCGDMTSTLQTIYTTTNSAVVRLITDMTVNKEGFRLEYQMIGCGGDIVDRPNGVITSPNYPSVYPFDSECYWHIYNPPGTRIELTIEDFDLEGNPECSFDFLRVYAGEDEQSPRLLNICHTTSNNETVVTSHGNQIYVHFKSDYSVARRGFKASFKQLDSGCGGKFTANDAIIMSQNFPEPYTETDECDYLIEVPNINLVQLEFYDFEMPEAVNCSHGYVAVYDGKDSSAPLLLKHCGAKPQGFISSTGSQMLVRIVADGFNVAKGFRAHYKIGCGKRLLADEGGEIMSPNYPDISIHAENCSWILYSSTFGEKISLTPTHLFIPDMNNCSYDAVFVMDGDMEDSPVIGQYCGHRLPPPIISRGSIMHVFMKGLGIFRATYGLLSSHCGGSFTSAAGSFSSPGFPTNYDAEMECVWTIEASPGSKTHITFQSFNIESSDFCNSDYLEIHANDPSGPLIGKYCGNTIPSNVSAAHKIWLKFRSDDIGTAPGFMAHYEIQHSNTLTGTHGEVASPGYPHVYRENEFFEWTVIVPEGMYISVIFTHLGITVITNNYNCRSSVKIYDGFDESAPLLGEFCGYQLPDPVVSTSNVINIAYYSRNYDSGLFYLTWSAVNQSGVRTADEGAACFQEYILNITNSTEITSQNYPSNYPHNYTCTYMIRAPENHHVKLMFDKFDFEGTHPQCRFDKLEFFIAPNPNIDEWQSNGTYCGRNSNISLVSFNNILKFRMTTDNLVTRQGFKAIATAECGGQIFGSSGYIRSSTIHPHMLEASYDSFQCEWVITVRQKRTIQITFDNFNIESDSVCSNTYLTLRNGGSTTSPLLGAGRLCGSYPPSVPETSSNLVYVQIVYNKASGGLPVFDLRYSERAQGCGGQLYLSTDIPYTEISSPNYPGSPNPNTECEWVIIAPSGTRMRVDFESEFHMDPNCYGGDSIEFLDLHDGGSENAEVLRRFCGHDQPSSVITTSNALFARYVTSIANPQPGFKATVRIAQCGGTISSMHSVIQSPNYPRNYGSSIECEWFLKMKYGYHLILNITEFQTPDASNCSLTDYLEIRDIDANGEILRTVCGSSNNLPLNIEVPGPFAYIKFKSNSAGTGKGFKMIMQANFDDGCGGYIEGPSGVITSPRYPNALAGLRDCFWRISGAEGRRIKVTFDALNLPYDEETGTCTSFIAIYNITHRMEFRNSNYTYRFCGNTIPADVDSSFSSLYISFVTDGLSAGQGFSLTYSTENEAICGGILNAPSGEISSPNFTVHRDSHIDCVWKIDTGENKTLILKFDVLDIPGVPSNFCKEGVLYIRTGGKYGEYIGGYCGNYTNDVIITTPFSTATIRMFANLDTSFRGIHAFYNTSDCGGTFDGTNAVITSPGYPTSYPTNTYCHWILTVPEGEIIQLTTVDMQLEDDCTKDYVIVRNGVHVYGPMVGKFCGSHSPAPIMSSGSRLSIIFHSDEFGTRPGFKMTTVEVARGCGGIIHMLQGNFSSPNFPSRYGNNVECVWTIEYSKGYLVKLDFLGRFDIEMDSTCSKDYLKLEENEEDERWTVRNQFCGSSSPQSIISKRNKMRITFHSNDRIVADGFNLRYYATCGGNFTDSSGDIISPNYPILYTNDLDCTYVIGKIGDYISLTFDEQFSVEGTTDCIFDYIEIFQEMEDASHSQGKFCGNIPPSQRILRGPVIVKFVTDYTYVVNGFKMHYEIMNCLANLTEPTGEITFPSFGEKYIHEMQCRWNIFAQPNRVISLRFKYFELEGTYACWGDYLRIYDGNITSPVIGTFCGNRIPIVKSTGNQLTLHFQSDRRYIAKGFSVVYFNTYGPAQGCGGKLNATSGEIHSLDFDRDGLYDSDQDCGWMVIANVPDQVIKVTFVNFDLEASTNGSCSADYLELREYGAAGPIMGRYCGSTLPSSIISAANRIYVHFHSDDEVNKAGFKITYTVVPSPCGTSTLVSGVEPKIFTSPNYPNAYPTNLRCRWILARNASFYRSQIQLSFTDFDVPCNDDYVDVKNFQIWRRVSEDTIRLCGPTPIHMLSLRSGDLVTFYSDSRNTGSRGFSATFKDASCSTTYSEDSGKIVNIAYPSRFNPESTCIINITASAGKTVAVYFKKLELSNAGACNLSYVKIYDGVNVTSPLIAVYCGYSAPNPVFSTGSSLFLEIKFLNLAGIYHMTYMATDKGRGCGGSIHTTDGAITSPMYPQPYNKTDQCIWKISVPGYHTAKLQFKVFLLNSTTACQTNYVEIYEGATEDMSSRLARYCGNDIPAVHETKTSDVLVKLVTDTSNNLSGFVLHFETSNFIADESANLAQRHPAEEEIFSQAVLN